MAKSLVETMGQNSKSLSVALIAVISLFSVSYLSLIPKNASIPLSTARKERILAYMDSAITPEYSRWAMQQEYMNELDSYDENDENARRRLQDFCFFCGCCTEPPAEAPTLPPTPPVSGLPGINDDTKPYIYVDFGDGHISYDSANTYCREQLGTELAALNLKDTRKTQIELVAEMDSLCRNGQGAGDGVSCWIGLQYSNTSGIFEWINNQILITNNTIHNWQNGEPVPAVAIGINDFCVILHNDADFAWKNILCVPDENAAIKAHAALCRNPLYIRNDTGAPSHSPTGAPTPLPTVDPTPSPTDNPSKSPTPSPTPSPSPSPTSLPTKHPTLDPTPSPTSNPSKNPTPSPSPGPTSLPSKSPTPNPTPSPTPSPTAAPTDNPSLTPSNIPTISPTLKPTDNPSKDPTQFPSISPSKIPTQSPSQDPSPSPTPGPTPSPSPSPTKEPSEIPSNDPTVDPTTIPTISPTLEPSKSPSNIPSAAPSDSPTNDPSIQPTGSPTSDPTDDPTIVPTTIPTKEPTPAPTSNPSVSPTQNPTKIPTTPSPTDPGEKICGDNSEPTGDYNGGSLQFEIQSLYEGGTIIFDASNSDFQIDSITARIKNELSDYGSTQNSVLTLFDAPKTDYFFTIQGDSNGQYNVITTCPPPTQNPTKQPTPAPTNSPTGEPTPASTENPTATPTNEPSRSPTAAPSDSPTAKPTDDPSPAPTNSPTPAPTSNPTGAPTGAPTAKPTNDPTSDPTAIPSLDPSQTPSQSPSNNPTSTPTKRPTLLPSADPTPSPTTNPTAAPTNEPSETPTATPTDIPSPGPSRSPSTPSPVAPFEPVNCGGSETYTYNNVPISIPVVAKLYNYATIIFEVSTEIDVKSIKISIGQDPKQNFTDTNLVTFKNALRDQEYTFTVTAKPNTFTSFNVTIQCPPPTAAPTPSPTSIPTNDPTMSPTAAPTTNSGHLLIWGNTARSDMPLLECSSDYATQSIAKNIRNEHKIGVSCCSSTTGSNGARPGCKQGLTYAQADAHCRANQMLLCSRQQIEAGAARGTGCSFDAYQVWTRIECNPIGLVPTQQPTENPTRQPTPSPTPAPSPRPTPRPTRSPSSSPTPAPSPSPTPSPVLPPTISTLVPTLTPTDERCGDDRKEWEIKFPCAGNPIFELVSTCNEGFAIRLSLDKIYEVDLDRRRCGNDIFYWGQLGANKWKKDLDFQWDGGNLGSKEPMYTVDGEEREVIRNKFSARLDRRVRGYGGKRCQRDAWFNVTVFFFVDERGGTFDLRNTGDPDDYITVEAFTLKYIIDAKNWPFKRQSDQLAVQFTASLLQTESGWNPYLYKCPPSNGGKGSYGGQGGGYWGKGSKGPKGKKKKGKKPKGSNYGNPYLRGRKRRRRRTLNVESESVEWYKEKKSNKPHGSRIGSGSGSGRELLHYKNHWKRNEKSKSNSDSDSEDEWGVDTISNADTFSTKKQIWKFSFEVDFRIENIIQAIIDAIKRAFETVFNERAADHIIYTHYFPRFKRLQFDGASIYYKPTFEWYQKKDITMKQIGYGNGNNHKAFAGEDVNSNPNFETIPEDESNGFFTEAWESMTLMNWIIVICGFVLFCCICHCCCGYFCRKKKQRTHENNSFIQLQ